MFLTPLILEAWTPGLWVVAEPLTWADSVYGILTVPVGLITDLASTPPIVRDIDFLNPNGVSRPGATAHDFLYSWRQWGKDKADSFLKDALLASGASTYVAQTFYDGVRFFGLGAWIRDAGTLESRHFDTPQHYAAWAATTDQTQLPRSSP